MPFAIYNVNHLPLLPPKELSRYDTFAEACSAAHRLHQVAHFDIDVDWEGCADFITADGTLYCIEPVGRVESK